MAWDRRYISDRFTDILPLWGNTKGPGDHAISPPAMSSEIERKDDLIHAEAPPEVKEEIAAHLAAQEDHEQTVSQALRSNYWTLLWLFYGVWIIVCCSFDSNAGSVVVGIPRFRQDFGYWYEDNWVLPAKWQSAYSGAPTAAQIVGTFVCGSE